MSTGSVSKIGLWGRSMGATTSIMYGCRDPTVAAIVSDSPFSSLNQVMVELVQNYKAWIPRTATRVAIRALRNAILARAHFDISDLNTIPAARACNVPIVIGHANGDDFVSPQHSETIAAVYRGDKNFIRFDGDHNSERPAFFLEAVTQFFVHHLVNLSPPERNASTLVSAPVSSRRDESAPLRGDSDDSANSPPSSGGSLDDLDAEAATAVETQHADDTLGPTLGPTEHLADELNPSQHAEISLNPTCHHIGADDSLDPAAPHVGNSDSAEHWVDGSLDPGGVCVAVDEEASGSASGGVVREAEVAPTIGGTDQLNSAASS
eukprot:TRINITY_DN9563_c0_g1_i1.p1 TRINITY_DN9563_c0_g1~~TRINITY_DN9563_c0_g1_i1.p1  ORF type:complete len:322 (+),score=48.09 TRINITY_DN9563_c0_g1_i1:496-1461(+)